MSEEHQQDSQRIDILDELDDLDKAIINLKVKGHKISEISEKLEKHRDTIYKRLKKFKVIQAIEELQKTALQILLDSQADAARTLRSIAKTSSDENKIKAAKEILKGVLSDKVQINGKMEIVYVDEQDKEL